MHHPNDDKLLLFTDFRHVRCGDLTWHDATGAEVSLHPIGVPEVPVIARAETVAHGVRLQAQVAQKSVPFESSAHLSRIVYDDQEKLYRTVGIRPIYPPDRDFGSYSVEPPSSVEIHYRESRDGTTWSATQEFPLDVAGQAGQDGFTFFMDPKAPESERFKGVYTAIVPKDERERRWKQVLNLTPLRRDQRLSPMRLWAIYAITSPDMKRWKLHREPLMLHISDTNTAVEYDAALDRYVMYTRQMMHDRRWIARAEAKDFWQWDPITPSIAPGLESPSDDLYLNAKSVYPGTSSYHLMFPMIYHRDTQRSDQQMWSSADNMLWQRVPGGPVLAPGAPGSWDSEFIGISRDLVPLPGDRVGISYLGTCWPHKYPRWPHVMPASKLAWASWPKHRLSALVSDGDGEFLTMWSKPRGKSLRLNLRTGLAGSIRVGIEGKTDRSVDDCAPIVGDHASHPVTWRGQSDIGSFGDDELVTLRVRTRCAELFAIEWM